MEKIKASEKCNYIVNILGLIEIIVSKNKIETSYMKDEIEKYYLNLLEGKDTINVYERRDAGISDANWEKAKKELYTFLGLKKENEDRLLP